MTDPDAPQTSRRRELMDTIGKASELHHHLLLVLVVLIAAQGIAAAMGQRGFLMYAAVIVSVLTLGTRLWIHQDQLASLRLRLRPLLEGQEPTPDAKTRQELEWLTQQDPLLERVSIWGLWLGAALFSGACLV